MLCRFSNSREGSPYLRGFRLGVHYGVEDTTVWREIRVRYMFLETAFLKGLPGTKYRLNRAPIGTFSLA